MKLPALALLLLACAAAAQSLPEEARKLVEKRAAEVHRINLAYAQALDALLAKYRAAGQAANAKAVEALIATAEGKKPDASADDRTLPVAGETSRWAWGSGGDLTLQGNGKAKHSSWPKSGTWRKDGDRKIVLLSDSGKVFHIQFGNDGIGKVSVVGGNTLTTLVRKDAKPDVPDDERTLAPLVGKWRRDYDKNIIEFKDTGSGIYAGTTPFTVSYDPDTKRVTLTAQRWVDTVSFTLHPDVLKGGHANKIPYKLTRIK